MNKTDIIKLLTKMNAAYQYFAFPKQNEIENNIAIEVWLDVLGPYPTELVNTAFNDHIKYSEEVPTPAHIMQKVKQMTTNQLPANQAYAQLMSSISRYGYYRQQECMECLPKAIQDTVKLMGGLSIFANADEGDTYLKNSFIKNYEQAVEVEERERLLPEGVREQRKALLDKFRGNNNVKMLQ